MCCEFYVQYACCRLLAQILVNYYIGDMAYDHFCSKQQVLNLYGFVLHIYEYTLNKIVHFFLQMCKYTYREVLQPQRFRLITTSLLD